jgi:hypothetical protein
LTEYKGTKLLVYTKKGLLIADPIDDLFERN